MIFLVKVLEGEGSNQEIIWQNWFQYIPIK